MSKPLALKYIR